MLGCNSLVIDPSVKAIDSGDFTLISSLCEAAPNRGLDVCYALENTPIFSSWRLIVPQPQGDILGGEVTVFFRDFSKTYSLMHGTFDIPFRDFFNQTDWTRDCEGEAMALASVRYKEPNGVEKILYLRGFAKILVLANGYARIPFDSGVQAITTDIKCKVQYSTSGRSTFRCEED